LNVVSPVSNRQNPSWCFAVTLTYSMPAAVARSTMASASKFSAVK